jgi:Flp pilus assembly pilin Flp
MAARIMKARRLLRRLLLEDDGMEMVEWSVVGVIFALACVAFWGDVAGGIDKTLGQIGDLLEGESPCGEPPCGRGRGRR